MQVPMDTKLTLSASALRLDAAHEVERIADAVRTAIYSTLKRRGAVIGISGDRSASAGSISEPLGDLGLRRL